MVEVISDRFREKNEAERQSTVWDPVHDVLQPWEQVQFVFTDTPSEAAEAGRPVVDG